MNRYLSGMIAALAAFGSILGAIPAEAQQREADRGGRPDWHGDRDPAPRPDRSDHGLRSDDRGDSRGDSRRDNRRDARAPRYYGGHYGYQGYQGPWKTGQRFPHYRERGYYVSDYRAYGLPAPQRGYRYYRTDNGDIVMAAVASGLIGLIVGGALAR